MGGVFRSTEEAIAQLRLRGAPGREAHLSIPTNASICSVHFLINSSSVNLLADKRALRLTASGSGSESALSKAATNSSAVSAWKPTPS